MIFTTTSFLDQANEDAGGLYDLAPTTDPRQSISIAVGGYSYQVDLVYNTVAELWMATVTDVSKSTVLCSSFALQYGRLAMGNWNTRVALAVVDYSANRIGPLTLNDMGSRCSVYIIDKSAYPAVWPSLTS